MLVKRRTSALKYSILKPHPDINSLRRAFGRPHPRCGYELAQGNDIAVRRYRKNIESLEQMLVDCQWRSEEKASIVHCLYVELMAPNLTSKNISVEVYVEDLEVTLSKMKKLLIPEAIYLILRAAEGYSALWSRFKIVSVDEQTIGLDCCGNCLVWLNSSLQKNQCDDLKLSSPEQIMREIIMLIKSRSQPACDALLSKLLETLSRLDFDFYESRHLVAVFAKSHMVKVPENLKYLVHQDRVSRGLEEVKTQGSIYESREQLMPLMPLKTPRFVPSRSSYQQDDKRNPKKRNNQNSSYNLLSTLRSTAGPATRFLTSRSINNKSIDSSVRDEDISQFQTRRKFYQSVVGKQNSFSPHHSRCKSQSYDHIQPFSNIRPKKQTETTRSIDQQQKAMKRFSEYSAHSKTGGSFVDKFKKSDHSLAELSTAKKLIHRSSNQMDSKKLVESIEPCEHSQFNEYSPFFFRDRDDEPTQQKIPINIISPLQSSDPTFHVIPEPDEVIRANQWTTTLRNLINTEQRLNTSITEGQDISNYLSDVRLDRLDPMSRQMVVSLIPEGSQKVLTSQQLIQ